MAPRPLEVCVTGGAGFIGAHVCRHLIQRGHEVTVVDDLSVGRRERVPASARLIVGDIGDAPTMRRALDRCEVVCHLAARVAVRSSFEFAVADARINVAGTASVLDAARRSENVRRVVAASSMAVYAEGPAGQPVDEDHPTRPEAPYGVSKLAAEQLTHMLCREAGIESLVLRLFNTYGPGQSLSPYVGVATIFLDALRRGDVPVIYGDGEQSRDFVHVDDVARAFVLGIESSISGETCNIGSGLPHSVNELLACLAQGLGVRCRAVHADPVAGELRWSLADITKARKLLEYVPARDFATAIAELTGDESMMDASC
jgi:UDP-glucose 4-epimerase